MPELVWQKSSFSGDDANRDCVEVAFKPSANTLLLRESDEPAVVIHATPAALRGLLRVARAGGVDGGRAAR